MKAFRGMFLFLAASSACFADNSVTRSVSAPAKMATALFSLLFIVAEIMELLAL